MSIPSGIRIENECINAVHSLRTQNRGPDKLRFVIFKVTEDQKAVVVEELSSEPDYEVFRKKLCSVTSNGAEAEVSPRYAVYDVEFDLGQDGKRTKSVFISWVPINTPLKLCMIYASTKEQLRKALDIGVSIHADSMDEIEWENILREASGGRL